MDLSKMDLGPKMLACSEQERAFVIAYVADGEQDATQAARVAGYVDNNNGAIRVTAHRLVHRDRVLEAIEEVGRKVFRGQLGIAVHANRKLLENDKHPDHHKAVQATLSRLGLAEKVGVDVNIGGSVTVNHTDAALNDLRVLKTLGVARAKLEEIFGFSGLDRYERMLAEVDRAAPKVIEHQTGEGANG